MNTNDPKYKARKKAWRQRNVAKRNGQRKRNYKKSRPEVRKHIPWSEWELEFLKMVDKNQIMWCDRNIAKLLKRSVQSCQQKRYLLRKENPCQ